MKLFVVLFFVSLIPAQLLAFSPGPGIVIYLHDLVLCVLLVCTAATWMRRKKVGFFLAVPMLAFMAAGVLSLLVNAGRLADIELIAGSLYLVRWVLYAGIYVVVRKFDSHLLWIGGLVGAGTGMAVLGLVQFALYPDLRNLEYLGWDPHYYRLFSTLLDPNFMGILLVLTILLLWFVRSYLPRLVSSFLVLITVSALYLTYSRSSFLALLAALTVLGLLKSHLRHIVILALAVMVGVVFIPKPGGDTLRLDRFPSTISRLENWRESAEQFTRSPLFGYGFNTLRYISDREEENVGFSRAGAGIDSSVLFVLVTTGIAGGISYSWLVKRKVDLIKKGFSGKKTKELATIVAASLAAVAVHSLFVNSAFYPWVMLWLWILAGVLENATEEKRSSYL